MTMLNNEILDVNHTLGLVNHGNTHQSRYCAYRAKRGNMGSECGGLERWGWGGGLQPWQHHPVSYPWFCCWYSLLCLHAYLLNDLKCTICFCKTSYL
jgi:hypothetical protein